MRDLHSIVLAAGLGTRISKLTHGEPKQLLKIGNETLIGRILRQLYENGISNHSLSYHTHTNAMVTYLTKKSETFGKIFMHKSLPSKGENLHAMLNSDKCNDAARIIVMGDNAFEDIDVKKFLLQTRSLKINAILLAVCENSTSPSGKYIDLSTKQISRKKTKDGINYCGLAYLPEIAIRKLLTLRINREYHSITNQINWLSQNGMQVETFRIKSWYDINNPNSYHNCLNSLVSIRS